MSVPPATEMFQFAGFASPSYEFRRRYPCGWVAPFGDPGITDRSHLPRAFRSVPRPSSPLSAKASTRCPYLRLIPGGTFVPPHKTAAHRGKTHMAQRPHMKTLLRIRSSLAARTYPPRSHDKLSLHPSNNAPARVAPDGVCKSSPNVGLVPG